MKCPVNKLQPMCDCKRVKQRIACIPCGYPPSEARHDIGSEHDDEDCDCTTCKNVVCKFCGQVVNASTAHLHQGEYVGEDCCWDERLRTTE